MVALGNRDSCPGGVMALGKRDSCPRIVPGQVWLLLGESLQRPQHQQFPFHWERDAGADGITDREISPVPQGSQILRDKRMKIMVV